MFCVKRKKRNNEKFITFITLTTSRTLSCKSFGMKISFLYLTPIRFLLHWPRKKRRGATATTYRMNKNDEIRHVVAIKCIQIGNYRLQHCIRMIIKASDYLLFFLSSPFDMRIPFNDTAKPTHNRCGLQSERQQKDNEFTNEFMWHMITTVLHIPLTSSQRYQLFLGRKLQMTFSTPTLD